MIRAALHRARAAAPLLAIVAAACTRDLPTTPLLHDSARRAAVESTTRPVFGPIVYIRSTGAPRTETASFTAVAGDTLTVWLSSTSPQGLSAWISVNSVRLFETGDGHRPLPDSVKIVARDTNAVTVWMGGKPGSSVRVLVTTPRPATPPPTQPLTVIAGASVTGTSPAGTYPIVEGTRYHYAFRPAPGFARLRVLLDGQPVSDSGTIVMSQAHWLAASADSVVTLDASEAALAQSFRDVLVSATPRESWMAYQQRLRSLSDTWGTDAARHLARVYFSSLDPVADLPALVRLDSAVAGLVEEAPLAVDMTPARVSTASASSRLARRVSQGVVDTTAVTRESMHILVVNGILNTENDVNSAGQSVARRIALDPRRFPRGSVTVSHYWNATLSAADVASRTARVCTFLAVSQARLRGIDLLRSGTIALNELVANLMACAAQFNIRDVDPLETIRWVQQAQVGEAQREHDIDGLAWQIRAIMNESKHVFVMGHSEGSVLTQLAVLRLKSDYAFNEITSPRCVGTISVAGAGTGNWPLSDRHARFVVAKHDLVTQLVGALRNTRPTLEDSDTRTVDSTLAAIEQSLPLTTGLAGVVALTAARFAAAISIHPLQRYLRSDEDWQVISGHLDDLYRTCAIGAVTVTPSARTLQAFGSADFSATWQAVDGKPLPTADTVAWSTDSWLATVASSGRVTAGSTTGIAPLVARVRRSQGTAAVTIVDDSLVATYVPPTIASVVTYRRFWVDTIPDDPDNPVDPDDPPILPAAYQWLMSISASAMPGATIANLEVRRRFNISPDSEFVVYSGPPRDGAFIYQSLPYYSDGMPSPGAYVIFAVEDFTWYRVIITDSHGLKTEFVGTSAEPHMGP